MALPTCLSLPLQVLTPPPPPALLGLLTHSALGCCPGLQNRSVTALQLTSPEGMPAWAGPKVHCTQYLQHQMCKKGLLAAGWTEEDSSQFHKHYSTSLAHVHLTCAYFHISLVQFGSETTCDKVALYNIMNTVAYCKLLHKYSYQTQSHGYFHTPHLGMFTEMQT